MMDWVGSSRYSNIAQPTVVESRHFRYGSVEATSVQQIMSTLYISHSDCGLHEMSPRHPESPARLAAVNTAITNAPWADELCIETAEPISRERLLAIHEERYLTQVWSADPGDGLAQIDADTAMNKHSLRAARLAAGAGVTATTAVMKGEFNNSFCAVRPPGHHAESPVGMGFCLFNNIALAAEQALSLGAERIAIIDFDVHHGNGTVEIFLDRPEVMVCSSFQYPFYPGRFDAVAADNICLTPLQEGTAGPAFRTAVDRDWSAALARHRPDIILVSAGFDAHREDPLAGCLLEDEDYSWVTEFIKDQATHWCQGRLVSMLEGGYQLDALARSARAHVAALL
ncbi:MAG: acetoin utilization deacetylase AcuC-like enzyme [Halieaceae bacterium]|jgi:acetoin utilization deacetylase AcuC-like enzyme